MNLGNELALVYERLDQFFKVLNNPPDKEDFRVNKRDLGQYAELKQAQNKLSIIPVVLLLLSMITAIILMPFTSGIASLIFQACLYGFSFLMAKSMMSENRHSIAQEKSENDSYAQELDYSFEKYHLEHQK